MKMIIDIYCRYPKVVEPIARSKLDKLMLKNKSKINQLLKVKLKNSKDILQVLIK